MKTYLKFILFLLLFVGFVFPGCDPVDCNCPDIIGAFFDIESLEVQNVRVNNDGSRDEIHNANIEVDWQQYILRGDFGVSFFGNNQPRPNFGFSLMPTAYGCSCIENGHNGSIEKLAQFKVITRNDFNEDYLANDTINALINISIWRNDPMDLDEFIQSDTSDIHYQNFDLSLKYAPTLSTEFAADIYIQLMNGEEYLVTNNPIKLMQ